MSAAKNLVSFPEELFPDFAPSLRPPSGELKALDAPLHEIAPGIWASGMPAFEVPSHVLCKIVPVPDKPGQFTLAPEGSYPGYVRMSDDIGHRLGLIGLSHMTLRRLLWAGFVDHIRVSPNCIFISIESLLEHFQRTANDCEREQSYWTKERCDLWRATCEGMSNVGE